MADNNHNDPRAYAKANAGALAKLSIASDVALWYRDIDNTKTVLHLQKKLEGLKHEDLEREKDERRQQLLSQIARLRQRLGDRSTSSPDICTAVVEELRQALGLTDFEQSTQLKKAQRHAEEAKVNLEYQLRALKIKHDKDLDRTRAGYEEEAKDAQRLHVEELEKLWQENKRLKEVETAAEVQSKELQRALTSTNQAKAVAEQQLNELQTKRVREVEDWQHERTSSQRAISMLEKQVDELQVKNDELRQEKTSDIEARDVAEKQLDELRQTHTSMTESKAVAEKQLNELQEKHMGMTGAMATAERRQGELQYECLQEENANISGAKSTLEWQLDELRTQHDQLRQEHTSVTSARATAEQQLDELQTKRNQLQQDFDNAKEALTTAEREHHELSATTARTLKTHQLELRRRQVTVAKLRERFSIVQREATRLANAHHRLRKAAKAEHDKVSRQLTLCHSTSHRQRVTIRQQNQQIGILLLAEKSRRQLEKDFGEARQDLSRAKDSLSRIALVHSSVLCALNTVSRKILAMTATAGPTLRQEAFEIYNQPSRGLEQAVTSLARLSLIMFRANRRRTSLARSHRKQIADLRSEWRLVVNDSRSAFSNMQLQLRQEKVAYEGQIQAMQASERRVVQEREDSRRLCQEYETMLQEQTTSYQEARDRNENMIKAQADELWSLQTTTSELRDQITRLESNANTTQQTWRRSLHEKQTHFERAMQQADEVHQQTLRQRDQDFGEDLARISLQREAETRLLSRLEEAIEHAIANHIDVLTAVSAEKDQEIAMLDELNEYVVTSMTSLRDDKEAAEREQRALNEKVQTLEREMESIYALGQAKLAMLTELEHAVDELERMDRKRT